MENKQSLLASVIFVVSIFIVSLVVLGGVIPLHKIYLTISAIILCLWNLIVAILVTKEWGK